MSSLALTLLGLALAAGSSPSVCEPLETSRIDPPLASGELRSLLSPDALPFGRPGEGWLWPVLSLRSSGDQSLPYPPASPRDFRVIAAADLVGLLQLDQPWTDARGSEVPAGVYTLRYVPQPRMKEHLGTTARSDFLLLVPAGEDSSVSDPSSAIEASRRVTGGHPAILQISPGGGDVTPCRVGAPDAVDLFLEIDGVLIVLRGV